MRRKAFSQWRKMVDPRKLIFVDETGFEDFARRYGRSPSNYPLPSFAPKVKPDKRSVISVVVSNYTAAMFEQAMVLPVTAIW